MTVFKKVAIGISGGVDSAVSAILLKSKGFDVHGVFMKNWDSINEMGFCSAEREYDDAKEVSKILNIPLTKVDFAKQYWNEVFVDLISDYESGLTPNPDILCNRNVKFKYFYEYCMKTLKADAIATGHYANTSFGPFLENYEENKCVRLLRPFDRFKDQTFFLSQVKQEPLRKTMFPIANYKKPEVRDIAKREGLLKVAGKKESTGICFVGKRPFQNFISEYVMSKSGDFIDIDTGKIVGKHNGIHHWTIGQRSRIGGQPQSYFILKKNVDKNHIYVGGGTEHPFLKVNLMMTSKPNWIYKEPYELHCNSVMRCYFRFQHTKPMHGCKIMKTDCGLIVQLNEPVRAVTEGQFAVFYSDIECFGSARILKLGPSVYFTNDR